MNLSKENGFSIVETMVCFSLSLVAMGVITQIIVNGNATYNQESSRIEQNDKRRFGFNWLVKSLRDSAAVIPTKDLDQDGTDDSNILGVNFSLDGQGSNNPVVRDGLLVFTDRKHQTVYFDRDEPGTAGHRFPDISGFDDDDGDGKSDLIGIGLVPQRDPHTGEYELSMSLEKITAQDYPEWTDSHPIPKYMVNPIPQHEGYSAVYWRIVYVEFKNLGEVTSVSKWQQGKTLVKEVVPYVTNPGNSKENFDTISYEGVRLEAYDYGHDVTFDTLDAGENDGVVDELEVGSSDPASQDNFINTSIEVRLIGTIRFNLRCLKHYRIKREDWYNSTSGVMPRAFSLIEDRNLKFPVPAV